MRDLRGRFATTGLVSRCGGSALGSLRRLGAGLVLATALLFPAAVARAQEPGDANCDGVVDEADLGALIARLFSELDCGDADPNLDGTTSAPDLSREVVLFMITPTPEPTPTRTPALGPPLTFVGLAGSGGALIEPSEFRDDVPVFDRNAGFGFHFVVEAIPGVTGAAVGQIVLNSQPGDPSAFPDLQIQSNRNLGNGNLAVCSGGVPAIDPPRFDQEQLVADALNDLSCRFSVATTRSATCTLDEFGVGAFANPASRIQYCFQVPSALSFGPGETVITLRVRDKIGNLGPTQQVIVRLPGSAPTSTITRTGTATQTPSRTATPEVTPTPPASATPTRTLSPTRTAVPPSATRTSTGQPTATRSSTGEPSATRTSPVATPTFTPTRPTSTPTQTLSGPSRTPTPTVATATQTRTVTSGAASPTRTPTSVTATRTRTTALTPTRTSTVVGGTPTRTRTASPTATPTGGLNGPSVTFMGIVRADNRYNPADLVGVSNEGYPIYRRPLGQGFVIVVEGKPKPGRSMGASSFDTDPGDPGIRPDLQIIVNRNLGDGSTAVCDKMPPDIGGVPAVDPPRFDVTQPISDAINDLACRFVDGMGNPQSRPETDACVLFEDGNFGFVADDSRAQFCSIVIPQAMRFPVGDTLVSVRLRDNRGDVGAVARMIIRVVQ